MTAARPAIDVNADLGEGAPNDARLLALVTSAGICCGAHAGGPDVARATLDEAARRGVAVGAHPGFADREGFGRRERAVDSAEVERLILDQAGDLAAWADAAGVPLRFLKPHGALYNQAQREKEVAAGVVAASRALGLPLLGQPGGACERLAAVVGVRFVREGFPDRRYLPDGRLVPRARPDAVIDDPEELAAQVRRLVADGLQTLCIHGDDPNAVRNAEALLRILDEQGVSRRFWG